MRVLCSGLALVVVACASDAVQGDAATDAGATTDTSTVDAALPDAATTDASDASADASVNDLTFYPDQGPRVDFASNCKAGIASDGSVYLYYQDRNTNKQVRSVSPDGLTFPTGSAYTTYENHPTRIQLPSGKWKRYLFDPKTAVLSSEASTDGITFIAEQGTRYQIVAADKGTAGIYDHYVAGTSVMMLYLGDLQGLNNTRAAISTDEGMTFTFKGTNVLGDDSAGGGANAFVDISSIALPTGGRRLFAMKGGSGIYSFTNLDPSNYLGWKQDPGTRVEKTAWGDATLTGLFDPTVVRLKDGRYRMYLTGGYGQKHEAIISATTK